MKRMLTAAGVERLKPSAKRLEIPDAGAQGLRLVIQPSGAKSWAMRFRRPDARHAKLTLGPVNLDGGEGSGKATLGAPLTLREARSLAAEVHRQRASGIDVVADRRRAGGAQSDTFQEVVQDFIRDHRGKRTWREIARVLGLDYPKDGGSPSFIPGSLAERWQDRPIGEVTSHDVHAAIAESIKAGKRQSENRGRKTGDALGALFKWAGRHRRHALTGSPMAGVWRPAPPAARQRVLNTRTDLRGADELRWFWSATGQLPKPFGHLFRLLILTGCRLAEIAELTRSELSDDFTTIHLSGARTKNGRPHVVSLSFLAQGVLGSVPLIEGCPFIFSTNGKTPVSGFSKAKARLDELMKRSADKVGLKPWRLHDLRRTAATGMASIGVAPHVIEAALNHVSGAKAGVAGTYNVEAYLLERREALERWSAHIASVIA